MARKFAKKSLWLKANERSRKAFCLVMEGKGYEEIAKELDMSVAGVKYALDRAIERWDAEGRDAMRTAATKALQTKLIEIECILKSAKETKTKLNAIEEYRKYVETISKLIGLNEPEKLEVSGEPMIKLVGSSWDKI